MWMAGAAAGAGVALWRYTCRCCRRCRCCILPRAVRSSGRGVGQLWSQQPGNFAYLAFALCCFLVAGDLVMDVYLRRMLWRFRRHGKGALRCAALHVHRESWRSPRCCSNASGLLPACLDATLQRLPARRSACVALPPMPPPHIAGP